MLRSKVRTTPDAGVRCRLSKFQALTVATVIALLAVKA